MAVKMRLRREGKRKQPFYRVVVADVRSPRDGRFIEDIGYYQPLREPSEITIDRDRALYWLGQGVQPSDAVRQLLRVTGIWEEFRPGDPGKQRATAAPTPSRAAAAPQTPTERAVEAEAPPVEAEAPAVEAEAPPADQGDAAGVADIPPAEAAVSDESVEATATPAEDGEEPST